MLDQSGTSLMAIWSRPTPIDQLDLANMRGQICSTYSIPATDATPESRDVGQRRWVIQEVSLAHEAVVHCGESTINWPWFSDGLGALQQVQGDYGFDETVINAIGVSKAIRRDPGTMLEILWEFHSTVCYDPRDRVFALYGLADDFRDASMATVEVGGAAEWLVDYTRHWKDTYTFFARYLIESGDVVGILRHLAVFGTLFNINPSRPSWVPNWSQETRIVRGEFPVTVNPLASPR
ncbi:hypothetical protein BR93DRAFT_987785 [Coniochaeta sp. PMI_546]|nr:hypothetical protein BR93DRAFT_987785 [Coniochaeta sp. PMI_546]